MQARNKSRGLHLLKKKTRLFSITGWNCFYCRTENKLPFCWFFRFALCLYTTDQALTRQKIIFQSNLWKARLFSDRQTKAYSEAKRCKSYVAIGDAWSSRAGRTAAEQV